MSYLIAASEMMAVAAGDLANIGSFVERGQCGGCGLDHRGDRRGW